MESVLAIGITIGLMFLAKVTTFPFFQGFFMVGILLNIRPISFSSILVILCMVFMIISNYFLNVIILSYPEMAICYISLYFFKEKKKKNILWILVFGLYIGFSFIFGAFYNALDTESKYVFFYVFPIIMLLLKLIVGMIFWIIDEGNNFFCILPLFEQGLFIGILLSNNSIHSIEYWYLLVVYTLLIFNDRSQLLLRFLKKAFSSLKADPGILPAVASGYVPLQSFHLVVFVYLLCYLQLYSSPFSSSVDLSNYVLNDGWNRPFILFLFLWLY